MKIENKTFIDEGFIMENCVFLNRDNNVSTICINNTTCINGELAVSEYLHKQTDYYKWAKQRTKQ